MAEQKSAKAGWYPHPVMADTLRYWDGEKWTDQVAPAIKNSRKMPGQTLPTWAITTLVVVLTIAALLFVFSLLV